VEFLAIEKSANTVLPVVPAEEKRIVKGAMPGSWDGMCMMGPVSDVQGEPDRKGESSGRSSPMPRAFVALQRRQKISHAAWHGTAT
jgi:hypothetical protein